MKQDGINLFVFLKESKQTFENYKNEYLKELKLFLNEYVDNTEMLFIKRQKQLLKLKLDYTANFINDLSDSDHSDPEVLSLFHAQIATTQKITDFLDSKTSGLSNSLAKQSIELLDLSNSSAVEKIIYLNELGIIDFLRTKPEFMGSINLMATILSAITDEKATTLQTSINKLISNDVADRNHPYRTKKTVNKVRQMLNDKNIKTKTSSL